MKESGKAVDAVILDLVMPGMGGIESLRRIRRFNKKVPVFILTAYPSEAVMEEEGATSFGRQMGSYPILVGVPLRVPPRTVLDTVVVDHGMRSLTGLPVPIEVNLLPVATLAWVPGVGRKRAGQIAAKRPFSNLAEFRAVAGPPPVDPCLSFSFKSPSAR